MTKTYGGWMQWNRTVNPHSCVPRTFLNDDEGVAGDVQEQAAMACSKQTNLRCYGVESTLCDDAIMSDTCT